jgi:hypothetical protein
LNASPTESIDKRLIESHRPNQALLPGTVDPATDSIITIPSNRNILFSQIRGYEPTHLQPVLVFMLSNEEEGPAGAYYLDMSGYVRKPVHLAQFTEATRPVGVCTG